MVYINIHIYCIVVTIFSYFKYMETGTALEPLNAIFRCVFDNLLLVASNIQNMSSVICKGFNVLPSVSSIYLP